LEIIFDLPFGFPINNIISVCVYVREREIMFVRVLVWVNERERMLVCWREGEGACKCV